MRADIPIGTCGCGKPLYPVLNVIGEQIGVTHTIEDEDYHANYFSGMRAFIVDNFSDN